MSDNNQKLVTNKNKHNVNFMPNILGWMLPVVFILLCIFLSLAWYIINYQVEQLVAKRTSEYAHSIVKIAADSSAEALLSEDNLQLELLTQNIAKDRYIRTATIYSSDGIAVSQFPPKITTELSAISKNENSGFNEIIEIKNDESEKKSKDTLKPNKENSGLSSEKRAYDYLLAKKNIPFTEKISFKGVTAGWFKIEIDGFRLESDFRENFNRIRIRVLTLAILLVLGLLYFLFRYKRKVDTLVGSIHLLVKRKAIESGNDIANSQNRWFEQVKNLAEASFSRPIRLRELRQHIRWQGEEIIESVPLVWLSIDLPKHDNLNLAQQVVTIEGYVKAATNAYATYFQGEIFAGGIVAFLDQSSNSNNASQPSYADLVSFIYLMEELLNSMDANIKLKAILTSSRLTRLYSDDSVQNRVILPQRKTLQISKLFNILTESNLCCLVNDPTIYNDLVKVESFSHKQKNIANAYLLKEANHDIINHVARISKTIIESDNRH